MRDGRVAFGSYSGALQHANLIDAQPYQRPLPRALRNLRLKEWQAFQFGNERYFGNVALFDQKLVGLVQLKLWDRSEGRKHLFERFVPPWQLRVPDNVVASRSEYTGKGCRVAFTNRLGEDRARVELDIEPGAGFVGATARLELLGEPSCYHVAAMPLSPHATLDPRDPVTAESRDGHCMYSHKGMFRVEGFVELGGDRSRFTPNRAFAFMDDHKGYYPRVMRWDWATAGGFLGPERFGFNLTTNQCPTPHEHNENCFWLGSRMELLPAVRFVRHDAGRWSIASACDRVSLEFNAAVQSDVRLNALVVESRYRGPLGRFSGHIVDGQGVKLPIVDFFGMAEEFYLKS